MGKTAKLMLSVLAVLAVLAGVFLLAPGFYAKGLDTIFPNVSLNGINLSRMTRDEAQKALIDAGYENNVDGVSVTVNFPNGEQMVITGRDAGLSLSAAKAADAALAHGRDGSFIGNGMVFLNSLLGKFEISDGDITELDEEYIRGLVSAYTKAFNDLLLDDICIIEEDRILIIKDGGGVLADENEVYDLTVAALHRAIEEHTSISTDYEYKNKNGEDIDLTALYNMVNTEPVSAYYDSEKKEVAESITGVSFDMTAAEAALNAARSGEQVTIPLILTEPEITTEQMEELLFRDALSTSKTYIDGTSNRLNNVVLSAAAINGLVLNPGETFSFNDSVGQRTAARGYKSAGAYAGGRTVQEIGGGICQTSSTLYESVLYADLEVVYRANHMFTVPYLPAGHDATVNWGTIDFKFKNNTNYPIRIDSTTEGRYITISIVGTKLDDNYVKYENVTISTTSYDTVRLEDESVEPGKTIVDTSGHSGLVVDTYRLRYDGEDNLLDRTLIHRSSYRAQDRVILVPVGTLTPEVPETESPTGGETPQGTETESPTGVSPDETQTPSESPAETQTSAETPAEASPEEVEISETPVHESEETPVQSETEGPSETE